MQGYSAKILEKIVKKANFAILWISAEWGLKVPGEELGGLGG